MNINRSTKWECRHTEDTNTHSWCSSDLLGPWQEVYAGRGCVLEEKASTVGPTALESKLPMRRGLPAFIRTQIFVCTVGILPRTAQIYDIVAGCTLTPTPTYTNFNPISLSLKCFYLIVSIVSMVRIGYFVSLEDNV